MNKTFIKTTDVETANKLTALGFKLVNHMGEVYTFLNEVPQKLNFESVEKSKIVYDDKLSL
jgi:hypothetical protein